MAVARLCNDEYLMKRTSFYALKRPLQERFIAATKGLTVPAPLAVHERRTSLPLAWVGASFASFVLLCGAVAWGYGEVDSSLALVSTGGYVVYGVLLAISLWCGVQAWAHFRRQQVSPFELATYLFPGVLIDATTPTLTSYTLTDAEIAQDGRRVLVRLPGRLDSFAVANDTEARELKERVQHAMRAAVEAAKPGGEWHHFDPLAEPRYSSPLVARDKLQPYAPLWAKWSPLLALVIASLVAPLLGATRNLLSERKLYVTAVNENTAAAYRNYLARAGGEKRPDVRDLRLPTAELNELRAAGDVAALEQYAIDNEHSKIKPAIDAILRQALLDELVVTARKDSMGALRSFVAAHAKHQLVQPEIENVRKKLTKQLHAEFVEKHAAKTDGVEDTFSDLLTYAAVHGPQLNVRFQRIVLDKVARADKQVSNSKFFIKSMLPSQYFDAERSRVREKQLFESLEARFKTAFDEDVLALKLDAPIEPGQELEADPKQPLLVVSHSTTMGGGIGNTRPNGIFVGVGLVFEARLYVPERADPLHLRYSTWRMPDLLKLREGRLTVPQVYENMAEAAFDNFEQRLTDWLVREPKET